MKQALFAPNYGDIFGDPNTVVELAKIAENSGWYAFFVYDHVIEWYKMDTPKMYHAFTTLAAIARDTEKIKIGTMVTPLNRRRPWIVARECLTLDHLSHGRFILGVGIGVKSSREFGGFSEENEMKKRAEMLDEGLEILQGLWNGEEFSFHGKHYSIDKVQFQPKPVKQPRIPIWVAGTWPNKKPFNRASRFEGVVPLKVGFEKLTAQEYRDIVNYISESKSNVEDFEFVVVRSADKLRSDQTRNELNMYKECGATLRFASIGDNFGTYEETVDYIQQGPLT